MKSFLNTKHISLSLLFLLPLTIQALEADFLAGLNADVAPFGIESVLPGGSLILWALEKQALSPGADMQLYAWTDRLEFASHLYLKLNTGSLSPFAGAGYIYLQGNYFGHRLNNWYPDIIAGFRIAIPRWPVLCPMVSVRVKPDDTDKNLIGLGGMAF